MSGGGRLRAFAIALPVLAGVLVWFALSRQHPVEALVDRPAPPKKRVPVAPPVRSEPYCRLSGSVEGGVAQRVYVHSSRAELDLEAHLLDGGRRFSAQLPEQGELFVVAVAPDGRTAERAVECGAAGAVHVALAFPATVGSVRVSGRCTYLENGAPAVNAIVRGTRDRRLQGDEDPREASWTVIAGDGGEFTMRAPAGRYAVTCVKDMDESEPVEVLLQPGKAARVDLAVLARASVLGRVVDEANEPVPEVRISARAASGVRGREQREERTAEDGRFQIRGLVPGPVTIAAELDGAFAEAEVVAKAGLPWAEVTLVLAARGLQIRGVVNDPDGVPVEGAAVRVEARGAGWRPARAPIERRTHTWADGSFAVGGLVPGRYRVEASAPEHASAAIVVEELDASKDLVLVLPPACRARVRVTPASPAMAVRVEVVPLEEDDASSRGRRFVSLTGQTGELMAIDGMTGSVALIARTEGAIARTSTRALDLCTAPDPIELDLAGDPEAGVIEAEVTDKNGEPLESVRVEVSERSATTNAEGRARVEGLVPGEYRVSAAEGVSAAAVVEAGRTTEVKLVLDRSEGDVAGVVVAQQRPVEGAAIRAECGDSGEVRSLREAPVVARTDASGSFSFSSDHGGVCVVRAESIAHGSSEPVTLRAGALPALIELASGGAIEGVVKDLASRAPVSPYTLTIRPVSRSAELDARTLYVSDAAGRFRVEGLAPGILSVAVTSARGRAHAEVELAPGETRSGVELAVFGEGVVRGRVVGPSGAVAGARVSIRCVLGTNRGEIAADLVADTRTGPDGAFEAGVAAGDPLRVYVSADGFYPWGSPPFALDGAGRPTELREIQLAPRAGDEEKEGGIGIMFGADAHGVRVIQFAGDSPAQEAGLELGDVVTAIDGTPAGRLPLVNWVVALRGPPGTVVVLEIERGTSPRFSVPVTRRAIGLGAVPDAP